MGRSYRVFFWPVGAVPDRDTAISRSRDHSLNFSPTYAVLGSPGRKPAGRIELT